MTLKNRYLGIDIGTENIKFIMLEETESNIKYTSSTIIQHHKNPTKYLKQFFKKHDIQEFTSAAVTGRMASLLNLTPVPIPKALSEGFLFFHPEAIPATLVNIGSHGFTVLEMRSKDVHIFRENGKCSQGTGNFLQQLTERFGLTVEEADKKALPIQEPAPLSGRCPVILKTDMTHLANKGENQNKILAGLFDAVAENVEILIKPAISPAQVYLCGGVSRSLRIRKHFEKFLKSHNMELNKPDKNEMFYDAIGAALEAKRLNMSIPNNFDELFNVNTELRFDEVPALYKYMNKVTFIEPPPLPALSDTEKHIILGFDMGSTGSKIVAIDIDSKNAVWNSYRKTEGNPVKAAKLLLEDFVRETNGKYKIYATGATGSGREIVGSMLTSCFGKDKVFVLNEIAAHAEGALYYDNEVDTIFEIGGQDAKYIRLAGGEIYDSAMNEACSAGTGSFIEEQGGKFENIKDIEDLADKALEAEFGISLGQHCSVFMAEVIDNALSAGKPQLSVIAGIYDSIIQNYLNRVKGSRSIGKKIFCQGMPFASKALAAAVARQTGRNVIIPPNPGLIGALGIALLTLKNLNIQLSENLNPQIFIQAKIISKDTFICKSTKGCGGTGNKCKIDRLKVSVAGETKNFIWGGSCSLYDKGSHGMEKLPDKAPDPFRERQELLEDLINQVSKSRKNETIAITDEFILKGMFPFFATFLYELGYDLIIVSDGNHNMLKRGIEENNVPLCAPVQLYGGVLAELIEKNPDHIFLPMIRDIPRVADEPFSTVCPMSQGSADLYHKMFEHNKNIKFHKPVIDMGIGNMKSDIFIESIKRLASDFGITDRWTWWQAYEKSMLTQNEFDKSLLSIGRRAIDFAKQHNKNLIVVLGRTYTIYNHVLNSNVPKLLRELGSIAIPVDCYPVNAKDPIYNEVYWGYSQINLRAAHQIRKTKGHYSVFCSNYSCGPDSFNLHFYTYIMEGKPFAIIETDGHAGDAGTKTRLEAFLYCVTTDAKSGFTSEQRPREQLKYLDTDQNTLADAKKRNDILLVPRMGENAPILGDVLNADGLETEVLPMPDETDLKLGRKYTSGKECLPATITLGSLLRRLEQSTPEETFAFFMPTAHGPCRFGMYNLFHKMVIKRLGYSDRVKVISQPNSDYFQGVSKGLALKALASFIATDLLYAIRLYAKPVEKTPGIVDKLYKKWYEKLRLLVGSSPAPSIGNGLMEAMGNVFGLRNLLKEASYEFKSVISDKQIPTVSLVGEIYVRLDPFANDFVINKLEKRGIRVKFAPFQEWLEYTDTANYQEIERKRLKTYNSHFTRNISTFIRTLLQNRLYEIPEKILKWHKRGEVKHFLKASEPYIRRDLAGEAVLTLGGPIYEYKQGEIQGVVSVGPLECMPNKLVEAQYFHVREDIGLPSLTLSLNGEPMEIEKLDNFVYEVKSSFYSISENKRSFKKLE